MVSEDCIKRKDALKCIDSIGRMVGSLYDKIHDVRGLMLDIEPANVTKSDGLVRVVHCRDCKHRPTGTGVNHDIHFPEGDFACPCRCEDLWYSWMPKDDWYCANGELRERSMSDG